MNGKKYGILLTIVTALAAAVAYHFDASRGLAGVGIGVAIGLVLVFISHFFTTRARKSSDTQSAISCVYLSVGASFVIVITSAVVVRFVWFEILPSAILTTMAFYLVYRFIAVLDAWPAAGVENASVRRTQQAPKSA